MDNRLLLQNKLESIFPDIPIYFGVQPQSDIQYPSIMYVLKTLKALSADNTQHMIQEIYRITLFVNQTSTVDPRSLFDVGAVTYVNNFTTRGITHHIYDINALTIGEIQ